MSNWEKAKEELDKMPEPNGLFKLDPNDKYKSFYLLPVFGYECQYIIKNKNNELVLYNNEENQTYTKEFSPNAPVSNIRSVLGS